MNIEKFQIRLENLLFSDFIIRLLILVFLPQNSTVLSIPGQFREYLKDFIDILLEK